MTFPGTYNINYYYGDTYEFRVYPKNSNGQTFSLENFDIAKFTLAPTRGAALADQISGYAAISSDKTNIICAITPENALVIDPTLQYFYDVEVKRAAEPYDIVYSLLTGAVNITQDVTQPTTAAPEEIPDNPTDLVVGTVTDTTIAVSWTAPTTGGDTTTYKLAIIPFTTDAPTKQEAIENATTTISSTNTSYTYFGLSENTDYSVLILSSNATGDANYSTVLTNETAIRTADNPATIEPDFTITNNGNLEYIIDGVANDNITVMRGQTYVLRIDAVGHPFHIQSAPPPYDLATEYNTGVAGNGTEQGDIFWTVAEDAPDTLFYVCFNHSNMSGTITVIDGVS